MVTYLLMAALLLFLAFDLLWKAKFTENSDHFFNLDNTNAMRGFWCFVVILVHVTAAYQNPIQDVIGSFAYIGVTFFFMTSGYGLALSLPKNGLRHFWRKRLVKLLVANYIVVLLDVLASWLFRGEVPAWYDFLTVNPWVKWLLVCYLFFWLSHRIFSKNERAGHILCMALIAAFCITAYVLKAVGVFTETIWETECFGFLWGILLTMFPAVFRNTSKKKWLVALGVSCLTALILGVVYLVLKPVVFFGDFLLKIVLGLAVTVLILFVNTRVSFGNKLNHFFGGISYEIFLVHYFVMEALEELFPAMESGWFIFLSIAATVAVSYGVHLLSECLQRTIHKIEFFR